MKLSELRAEIKAEVKSELENRVASLEERIKALESKSGSLESKDLLKVKRDLKDIEHRIKGLSPTQKPKAQGSQEDRQTEIQMVDSKPSEEKRISSISDLLGLFRKQE